MSGWSYQPLGDLIESLDARRQPVREADRRPGPYPYYGASGVVDHVDGYIFEGLHLLVAEDGENLRTRKLPIAFLADGRFWVNNHAHVVRGNARADTRFLSYALMIADLGSYLSGSTMPKLTQGNLHRVPIYAPNLDEQIAIAVTLGSLDDKIELNRRMNETLEAIAQAIFGDWFVNFGPVQRKLAGATDPVVIMGGLMPDPARAAELAGMFPDALGDDDAPTDWALTTLGEAFDVKIGRTPPRKEAEHFAPKGVGERWMSIRDMGACGAFITATAEGLTATAVEKFRVPPISDQTVVVSFKLTVGRVAITSGTTFSNEAIAQLRAKAGSSSPWFTYCWMKVFDYTQLGSTSSIATAVNSDSIKGMPFPNVPSVILSAFDKLAEPIFERIRASIFESETLAETRNYLLPRLMSGEVRVRDVEAMVT